jgi:hypothetical protein
MKHHHFARQHWLRVLVSALLVALNLTPVWAQEINLRFGFPCRFCPRPDLQIEPQAGRWKTWVLTNGAQFRLPEPPDGRAQQVELRDLMNRANRRDAATLNAISFWDSGPPAYRWNEIAVARLVRDGLSGPRSARILSLLNVAIYDATSPSGTRNTCIAARVRVRSIRPSLPPSPCPTARLIPANTRPRQRRRRPS